MKNAITLFTIYLLLSCYAITHAQIINNGTISKGEKDNSASKYEGFQISRTDLFEALTTVDPSLHFKETPKTKGLPQFTAIGSNAAHVEITGSENNITNAVWILAYDITKTINKDAISRMAFFVNTLTKQEGAIWLFQQIFAVNNTPTIIVSTSTNINGSKVLFFYDPSKKTISVTITIA